MPARIYNWEKWFRQKRTTLVQGKHFHSKLTSMVAQIRTEARRHGVRVTIKQKDSDTLIITDPRPI